MGKRKRKDKYHYQSKIRRLEERLRELESDSTSSNECYDRYYQDISDRQDRSYTPSDFDLPLSDSEASMTNTRPMSVVTNAGPSRDMQTESTVPTVPTNISNVEPNNNAVNPTTSNQITAPAVSNNIPSTSSEAPPLPPEILEALGDQKGKDEVFGPKISEEIAKRWGRVLEDGLTKEKKQEFLDKSLIPENFRLAKAPLLNPELIPVLSDASRHRDKALEKSQNQLGKGISGLTNLATFVIEGNTDKIEILKRLSEVSQIFLDLHYEDTKRRRKLVTSSLDKKFLNMITDIKRDSFLFGTNLTEKIKTSKTAERSGLQIKRTDAYTSASRKYQNQGNWRGPPRAQAQRTARQGGHRNRYTPQYSQSQPYRRPPPVADRRPPPSRSNARPRKTQ